ncbi:uncharacterized protein STEHIDRAFT_147023, partial [Stereum hirsutum FP-91666 SS1]|uniref:uncharacterized protein n=1 Tax=Stereum hirsutum (strain FP-91666) TaxID=721885 RepID=UPI000440AC39
RVLRKDHHRHPHAVILLRLASFSRQSSWWESCICVDELEEPSASFPYSVVSSCTPSHYGLIQRGDFQTGTTSKVVLKNTCTTSSAHPTSYALTLELHS